MNIINGVDVVTVQTEGVFIGQPGILSLGILGFPRPNSQHVQQCTQRRPLARILVSTRLVPYTICLMNSPPIGCTNSQHTVCSPTKCVIGYSAPTGNWRVKLGNGKLSLGFVEAIKVFFLL